MPIKDYYEEGRDAYHKGAELRWNPSPAGTTGALQWRLGWMHRDDYLRNADHG